MTNRILIISLLVIPVASFFLYLPWQQHLRLFHPSAVDASNGTASAADLNTDSCRRVAAEGFGWCAEPVVVRATGTAYFACDDSRPWWDPVRLRWGAVEDKQGGSIWAWNMSDDNARPYQPARTPQGSTAEEPFHPLSISAIVDSTATPQHTILLISNHPHANAPGVIDVYVHDSNDALQHFERIEGTALNRQSPAKVVAIAEQWSDAEEKNGLKARTPSFLFSALPHPSKAARPLSPAAPSVLSKPPSIHTYLRELFLPSHPSPPSDVFLHLSTAYAARAVFSAGSTYPTFSPLIAPWDGSGSAGGSNSTLHAVYASSTDAKHSLVEQWDQHWVRGIAYGSELLTNRRSWKDVRVRWPDFVTFWSTSFKLPVRAMDIDSFGRIWTASASDEGLSERRIEELRGKSTTADNSTDAGSLIHQTTFLHRLGSSIAHPWEVERIGSAKKRGIWLPKEFYSTLIYRRGRGSSNDAQGYLPQSPTGIAVDEDRKRVIVTSSWADGVAVCQWKQGWAEM